MDPLEELRQRWLAEASAAGRVAEARALADDADSVSADEALEQLRRSEDDPEVTSPWWSAA